MADKELIVDLRKVDFDNVIADVEEIRRLNPQRYELEQLTAIVYENLDEKTFVGYKDVTDDEFWVRGHMPGMPLMPGVVMLEAAAQLCSYFTQMHNLLECDIVGFGGLNHVRFRGTVRPGQRLILMGQLTKVRARRMLVSRFQGIVNDMVVVEGEIKGIPLPISALTEGTGDT